MSEIAIFWMKLSRGTAEAQALLNWSGQPVNSHLDRDPKLLRRPLLLAGLLPLWQEPAFNLRAHYSARELSWQTLDELFTLPLLSECRLLCAVSNAGHVQGPLQDAWARILDLMVVGCRERGKTQHLHPWSDLLPYLCWGDGSTFCSLQFTFAPSSLHCASSHPLHLHLKETFYVFFLVYHCCPSHLPCHLTTQLSCNNLTHPSSCPSLLFQTCKH